MRYFRDLHGKLHAFDDDISNAPPGLTEMSEADFKQEWSNQNKDAEKHSRIAALEASVTARNLRGAALGIQFDINAIQSIENQIAAIRAE